MDSGEKYGMEGVLNMYDEVKGMCKVEEKILRGKAITQHSITESSDS